jgi:hypothetical protein
MWLTEGGWIRYHEVTCSQGHPRDCVKKCILWKGFDGQEKNRDMLTEDQTYAGITRTFYQTLRPWKPK